MFSIPLSVNASGNAIAVDANFNAYVAGSVSAYSRNPVLLPMSYGLRDGGCSFGARVSLQDAPVFAREDFDELRQRQRPVGKNWLGSRAARQVQVPHNFRNPYTEQWNFGIQHSFTPRIVAEVRYVGNHARALPAQIRLNSASAFDSSVVINGTTVPLPGGGG